MNQTKKPVQQRRPLLVQDVVAASPRRKVDRLPVVQRFIRSHLGNIRRNRPLSRRLIAALAIAIILVSIYFLLLAPAKPSPVPAALLKNISFPVYYPAPDKLPPGYQLDAHSFNSPSEGVIIYAVNFPDGRLLVSEQDRPSSEELAQFNSQRLPIHYDLNTPLGKAAVGIIGNKLVTSLPTSQNSWIIITAPQQTRQVTIENLTNSLIR